MVCNIEFYAYLPKIWIYFFLHFDLRSNPDPDPHFFSNLIRIRIFSQLDPDPCKKMSDPHPWKFQIHLISNRNAYMGKMRQWRALRYYFAWRSGIYFIFHSYVRNEYENPLKEKYFFSSGILKVLFTGWHKKTQP